MLGNASLRHKERTVVLGRVKVPLATLSLRDLDTACARPIEGCYRSEPNSARVDPQTDPPSRVSVARAVMDHEGAASFELLSTARCGELLGAEADGLSDREIDEIGWCAETMANVIVVTFREQLARQMLKGNRRPADDLVDLGERR
jgi:hypothetical protein